MNRMFDLTADEYTLIMQPLTKAKEYFKPGSELSKELAHVTGILDKKTKGMPQCDSYYSNKTKEQKIYELLHFYSSHEHETKDYTWDMVEWCYCGIHYPRNNGMQPIIIERNGKRRHLFRCPKCREDMHNYKPKD